MPFVKAESTPDDPIVATAGVPLLQVPPGVASLKVVPVPAHKELNPVIGDKGFTVTVAATKHPPGMV